ncbi:M20/M25/M40 family metallo-hydrolase [Rossellomorea vietnamensis]|uniref:M20/M25/M40 family metallo-hydrolase n=1 Tax=Rossellomorea vietnamensis TaxID=218284 RepID=UPI003D2A78E1
MKKTWNQLFVRQGWSLDKVERNIFDCSRETEANVEFLIKSLDVAGVDYTFNHGRLILFNEAVLEEEWLKVVDYKGRGHGEGLWFRPGIEQPKVAELDTYVSGIVRQLNRLGFYTKGSCDGHERRPAHVMVTKERNLDELMTLLLALGIKKIYSREKKNSNHITLHLKRNHLLDLAEKLSLVKADWVRKGEAFIRERMFQHQLGELLMIPGASGNEGKVRDYVVEKLIPLVDHLTIDRTGNILAEKTYKTGHGPVILLNAHLDTVYDIEEDREIIKGGKFWSSSKGILGADDRAGVAVLLHIAESLHLSTNFNGKVKFIFTVEEECGLVGANEVDAYYLWNTDAAIVVDRRGTGDIVTSCGGYVPFCDQRYGAFFEEVAISEGLNNWKATSGGSSDTWVWAMHGIQSANLSVGYFNEHSDKESLDVQACYRTAKLIEAVFTRSRELKKVIREIKRLEGLNEIIKEAL